MAAALLWAIAAVLTAAMPAEGTSCRSYVRRSCAATLYPSLCYSSLLGYVCEEGPDPAQIVHYAANLSLARVSALYTHVIRLDRAAAAGPDGPAAAALSDCAAALCDAADLSRQAAAEIGLIPGARGPDLAWHVSNAQTWMSAALTNEDTCADGFHSLEEDGGAAGPPAAEVRGDVIRRVRRARKYTSNALALLNRLVGVNG